MSGAEENILSRKITGLTWGVVLTILTVFGGGAVAGVSIYVGITRDLASMVAMMHEVKNTVERNHVDDRKLYDDLHAEICTINGKLIPQAK